MEQKSELFNYIFKASFNLPSKNIASCESVKLQFQIGMDHFLLVFKIHRKVLPFITP
jgi:hypothetical protein